VIIYKKGYQQFENGVSTVTTKLKGAAFVDFGHSNLNSSLFRGITAYDAADYIVPPQVNHHLNFFFNVFSRFV